MIEIRSSEGKFLAIEIVIFGRFLRFSINVVYIFVS